MALALATNSSSASTARPPIYDLTALARNSTRSWLTGFQDLHVILGSHLINEAAAAGIGPSSMIGQSTCDGPCCACGATATSAWHNNLPPALQTRRVKLGRSLLSVDFPKAVSLDLAAASLRSPSRSERTSLWPTLSAGRHEADAAILGRPNSTSQLRSWGAASPLRPSLGKSNSATLNASSRCG